MALFQSAVLKKYIQAQNKSLINEKWESYKSFFLDPAQQERINSLKEEQYQYGFLNDLFVKILGYTLEPNENFNLSTEYKNVKDSKKADGAIVIDAKVLAVIELKGTNTTDLGKIETQAFGYKNNQPDCVYIITSNFEKVRFYIDNAIEFIEFNLFQLQQHEFELMYLCLAHENISKGIAKKLKDESVSQEDVITKKLYKDYSLFKRELFTDLVAKNPHIDQLQLFKKSQKLLDRFLFVFFAEDRQLLPPNSVRLILEQWSQLKELDAEVPLYERFKKYFGYLNTGFKGKNYDVYAYNGGLFKPDDILDNIIIDDDLLYKHTLQLSEYDFDSEVDVNILGHIFENSLNEIDEIKAELEGEVIDKSKSKRKKDGVFYTPKYITKYIVENTIGKLCNEKKNELQLLEEEYIIDKKRQKKTLKTLLDKLETYRKWLLQLTICDPACGSGAFLNQALDFLIEEHKYIDELQAKLFGDAMVLSDVEKSILENNLFGVDLNEESVEIAKLSLWLRTALPNRKLNDLSGNIKCGNSLIDDPEVAGEKAFNWQTAFPQVFAKGGFDVIIGNPPYGASFSELEKEYYKSIYETATSILDTYILFIKLGIQILKNDKSLGYIIPSTWTYMSQYKSFRLEMLNTIELTKVLNFKNQVFQDATVETGILFLNKSKPTEKSNYNFILKDELVELTNEVIKQSEIIKDENYNLLLKNNFDFKLYSKISKNKRLKEISKVVCGLTPYRLGKGKPKQSKEIVENKLFDSDVKKDDTYRQYLMGRDFQKYCWQIEEIRWISYGDWLAEPRYAAPFNEKQKIVIRQTSDKIIAHLDKNQFLSLKNVHNLKITDDGFHYNFLLAILNSKLIDWWYQKLIPEKGRVFAEVKVVNLNQLPICYTTNQNEFIEKAELMLSLNKELQDASSKFQRALQREFSLETLPKKLENWYELSYADFLKELKKKKVELSLGQKGDWEDYFLQEQLKAVATKNKINTTDKEIDAMVYALYGLTEEEIAIVESSN